MDKEINTENFYKSFDIKSNKKNIFKIEINISNDDEIEELIIYTSKLEEKIKTEYIKKLSLNDLKKIKYFTGFDNLKEIAQQLCELIDYSYIKENPPYIEESTNKIYLNIPMKDLIFEIEEKEKTNLEMIQDLNIKVNDLKIFNKENDQKFEDVSKIINNIENRLNKKDKEIIDIKNLYDKKIEEMDKKINEIINKKFVEQNNKINLMNEENAKKIKSNLETINEIKTFFIQKFNDYHSKLDSFFNEFDDFKKLQNENNNNNKDLINKNLDDFKNNIKIYNDKNYENFELNQKENNAKIENLQKILDDIFNNQNETDKNIDNFKNEMKKINNSLELMNEKFVEISEKEKELVKNIESLKNQNKNENNNFLKTLAIKNNIKKQEELNKVIENKININSNENNKIYNKEKKKNFSEKKLALNFFNNINDNLIKANQIKINPMKDIINNLFDNKFISSDKIYYCMLEIDIKDFNEDLSDKILKKYAYILSKLEKYLIKGTKILDIGSGTGYL